MFVHPFSVVDLLTEFATQPGYANSVVNELLCVVGRNGE